MGVLFPYTGRQRLTNARGMSNCCGTATRQHNVSIVLWLAWGHGANEKANTEIVEILWAALFLKSGTMMETDPY